MQSSFEEPEIFRHLRERSQAEGGVFWNGADELCVFDPAAAQHFNRENFRDQTLSDRLVDLLLQRPSPVVSWQEIRAAWAARLAHLTGPDGARQLSERMESQFAHSLGRELDLSWWAQEVCSRSLVPAVVDALPPTEHERVLRDQWLKARRLLASPPATPTPGARLHSFWVQTTAGFAVRRELRRRARGRRPRQLDLADPIVDLLPRLGMDRAVDAVTAVLTAIAGPPGSAAACLLYELMRRPEWVERIRQELKPLSIQELCTSPTRAASATHRFVKESLRMWSLPLLMVRPVHTDMKLGDEQLHAGQRVLLSTWFIHHDPRFWDDADTFDPGRFETSEKSNSCPHAAHRYVPFGWSPRSCIGAGLGILQLMLLCRLVCGRYRIALQDPQAVQIEMGTVPRVVNFRGTIERH